MGQVYLIRAGSTDLYKVGYTSKTPEERRAALQTGNPYPLEVVASWYGSPDDEKRLHGLLDPFRREGEWFHLTVADLLSLLAQYAVLAEVPEPEAERPLTDQELREQIKQDIQDAYWEYGPVHEDGGRIEVSEGYQSLLRMGILRCTLWRWYDEDALCRTLPFDRHERYQTTTYFDYCVKHGYIQKDSGGRGYRVDPHLSEEGYEFLYELAEDSF